MSKAYRPVNPKYIDSTGIVYRNNILCDYLDSKPDAYKITVNKGQRNCVAYIGKTLVSTTGSGNAGVLEVKCFLPGAYSYSGSVTWYVSKDGSIYDVKNYWITSSTKTAYTYSDGTYIYFFIYVPNYNDNWVIEIVNNSNFSIVNQLLSHSEFSDMISGMTLVDRTCEQSMSANYCKMHVSGSIKAESGKNVEIKSYILPTSYGAFTADTSNGRLTIPAYSCRLLQVGGVVCGSGYAFISIKIKYEDGTDLIGYQSSGILVQSAGNNYWKQALPCITIPIDDRSQNVYVTLTISGYNQSFTINNGFGSSASNIWALGLY